MNAARVTGKHVGRVMHLLWLEVTGFVFLAIGAIAGLAVFREYHRYQAGQVGINRVVVAVVIAALCSDGSGLVRFGGLRKKR